MVRLQGDETTLKSLASEGRRIELARQLSWPATSVRVRVSVGA